MTDRQVKMQGRWAGYKQVPREIPKDFLLDGQGVYWLRGYDEGHQYRMLCKTEVGHDPVK